MLNEIGKNIKEERAGHGNKVFAPCMKWERCTGIKGFWVIKNKLIRAGR